jgi:COP9 signalosome complex subunit 2
MSDEESYEYDDDADEDMAEDNFEYTDEEEEADDAEVALENAYYNAKGLREDSLEEAAQAFEQVITSEKRENDNKYGLWSFKSMKQLVKLYLKLNDASEVMRHYQRLLECVRDGVSPNAVEKGIHGMLDRISQNSNLQGSLTRQIYEATLAVFSPKTGTSPNERLWFKTNIKYGQLMYELNETFKLQSILRDLQSARTDDDESMMMGASTSSTSSTSTQLMEIYALEIQLYSRQKDLKKLRLVYDKAMAIRGGIPHPRTIALIQELGGKMHMAAREFEAASQTFFQAFKSYDEAGDPNRLKCLKYLVMASMLHASTINPFDSQEARPYRDDPEIQAMTNLVQAFHNNDIQQFESILKKGRLLEDEFVREHVEDLLRTIRTQVLNRVLRPYTRISLQAIAKELNDISVQDVEKLLVSLILDKELDGSIDQVDGILIKKAEKGLAGGESAQGKSLVVLECEAMDEMVNALEKLSNRIASICIKDSSSTLVRGMVL